MTDQLLIIETMIKHLPPSGSTLRLLDVNGAAAAALRERAGDIEVAVGSSSDENYFDAVVGYGEPLDDELLSMALFTLRPGGRLIVIDPQGDPSSAQVKRLEAAGYTRILVEEMLPSGVLMRGEKPHVNDDTLARIQSVADRDATLVNFSGRYIHLLIRQTPNKPIWALKEGESVTWQAVALPDEQGDLRLLAFTSLPKAVAFMQPAVIAGDIKEVNKVAKFSSFTTSLDWQLLMNPTADVLYGREVVFVPIDPASAETPDE
ncbi:MAG: hypothetical protein GC204_12680 [Chloroflexi bacterium]|nr:hypothetical protein [Chloroflexota bacterium]